MTTDFQKWINVFKEVNKNKIVVPEADYWQADLMRDIRSLHYGKKERGIVSGEETDLNRYLWKWALLCVFFAAFFFLYGSYAGGSTYGYLYSSLFIDPYTSMLGI